MGFTIPSRVWGVCVCVCMHVCVYVCDLTILYLFLPFIKRQSNSKYIEKPSRVKNYTGLSYFFDLYKLYDFYGKTHKQPKGFYSSLRQEY